MSGKSHTKPADCTASTLRTSSPIVAEIHDREKEMSSSSPAAPSQRRGLPCGRKPTSSPTPSITRTVNMLRPRSPSVRPVSTAERDIGRERKRSTRPWVRSVASPTPVVIAPKETDCTKIPAMR